VVYQVLKPLLLVWDGPRRVWVVPGGDTRGVSGFQPPRLWGLFVGIDLGFPERGKEGLLWCKS
jgi:hypothetical protein